MGLFFLPGWEGFPGQTHNFHIHCSLSPNAGSTGGTQHAELVKVL